MTVALREIHFYAPGLRRYRTSEWTGQEPGRFVSVSVTGAACALQCDHCQSKVLEGMWSLGGATLYDVALEARERGARGILVSGGSDRRGRVPLLRHVPDLKRIRQELGLLVRLHPGLPDEETAAALGEVGVDGAMLDIIGAQETIREIYHLDVPVGEYAAVLERLDAHGVPLVPHIILGLHRGRMLGEWTALSMVARHRPRLLVLVVLMPMTGTAMRDVTPPSVAEVGAFFQTARAAMRETPIALGCARPLGPVKAEIDRCAVEAGLDGIAYPAEGIVAYARSRGLTPRFHDACCGIDW
ncbi:MAG: radical SAM protein [Candidatus Rokubacteria bacterium]|nr:radical SAM protein [Candidatus Rokubacteria bacterium]MBI2527413.1 radical SAM protein [Candidatus Rokubacteria bacterium]